MRRDLRAPGDQDLDHVRQIQLALHVLRLQLLDRRPERVGPEDVDRRVDLADRQLLGTRVGPFCDPENGARAVPDDAPIEAWIGRLGTQDRRRRLLAEVGRDELGEQFRSQERRVAGEDEDVSFVALERGAGGADRVSGPERVLLDGDGHSARGELVARTG